MQLASNTEKVMPGQSDQNFQESAEYGPDMCQIVMNSSFSQATIDIQFFRNVCSLFLDVTFNTVQVIYHNR